MEAPLDLSLKKFSNNSDNNTFNPPINNGFKMKNPSKNKTLFCHFCFKQFDRPSLLKRHILTHTGNVYLPVRLNRIK